jgi:BMFP domain-containing protein YqiC
MTQTSNRIFDEMARLMGDAASVAQGVKREAETAFRSQMERFVADMDLIKREEFDVVRDMASKARTENAALKKRIADLESQLGAGGPGPAKQSAPAKPKRAPTRSKAAEKPAAAPKKVQPKV